MERFRNCVEAYLRGEPLPEGALDALAARYPWFRPVETMRNAAGAPLPVDAARLTAVTSDDLIDRFLRSGDYRIVVDEQRAEVDVRTTPDLDDEDDLVSEDLAEIYLQQGLIDEAKAIYRKLSLRNPEKSVYFAELIERSSEK